MLRADNMQPKSPFKDHISEVLPAPFPLETQDHTATTNVNSQFKEQRFSPPAAKKDLADIEYVAEEASNHAAVDVYPPPYEYKDTAAAAPSSTGEYADDNLSPATKLKRRLEDTKELIVCPGVYDGFSARIALSVGFDTMYMVRSPYKFTSRSQQHPSSNSRASSQKVFCASRNLRKLQTNCLPRVILTLQLSFCSAGVLHYSKISDFANSFHSVTLEYP